MPFDFIKKVLRRLKKNCSVCNSGKLIDSYEEYVARVMLRGFVIIKNVPCKKCDNCGHKVFSYFVMKKIEKLVEEAEEKASEIFTDEETFFEWSVDYK